MSPSMSVPLDTGLVLDIQDLDLSDPLDQIVESLDVV